MLTTILVPTEGTATVAGADIIHEANKVRERIGVVTQASTLDNELSALENMNLYGKYYGMSRKQRQERIPELLRSGRVTGSSQEFPSEVIQAA